MAFPAGIRSGSLAEYYDKEEIPVEKTVKLNPYSDETKTYFIMSASVGLGPHGRVYVVRKKNTKTVLHAKKYLVTCILSLIKSSSLSVRVSSCSYAIQTSIRPSMPYMIQLSFDCTLSPLSSGTLETSFA